MAERGDVDDNYTTDALPAPSKRSDGRHTVHLPDANSPPPPPPASIVSDAVTRHYNQLRERSIDDRRASVIVQLRNFNNWVKSMLIGEFGGRVPPRAAVLDIACGKGGDLLKWRQAGIGRLVCVDIASQSVEQCRVRYKDMVRRHCRGDHGASARLFDADFLVADCTRESLAARLDSMSWPTTDNSGGDNVRRPAAACQFDLVSVQFALHYGFESQTQAEQLLDNISCRLRVGGFFIATVPDANTIVRRAAAATDGSSFGNRVYGVRLQQPLRLSACAPPLFGARYHFYLHDVVDCPEFLVYRPLLERMCERRGLRSVFNKNFAEMFAAYGTDVHSGGSALLTKMRALETFPARDGATQQVPFAGEYEHARAVLGDDEQRACVGTMSLSEWQACSLYVALAFEKVKEME